MLAAILLDFDGVIVESVGIKTDAFRDYFGRHYPHDVDRIVEYHLAHNGISRMIKFKHIYEEILKIPFTENLKKQIGEAFSGLVKQKVVTCPMVPGAWDFLSRYSRHLPLYLCSATPETELTEIVDQRELAGFFKKVFGFPQTKDAAIQEVLTNLKCPPDKILFIGDSLEDYRAASYNEVRFLARQNFDDFSNLTVRTFPDLAAIDKFLLSESLTS